MQDEVQWHYKKVSLVGHWGLENKDEKQEQFSPSLTGCHTNTIMPSDAGRGCHSSLAYKKENEQRKGWRESGRE